MIQKLVNRPDLQQKATQLRSEGWSFDRIAAEIGVTRNCVREYLLLSGGVDIARVPAYNARQPAPVDNDRDPLPPGSDVSWGAITRGTCLEGSQYHHSIPGYSSGDYVGAA